MKETNNERLILEAAEAEFLEKGYGKARTTEIAKRAGLSHAMLHYYFRTKDNLFEVIFQKKAESMSEVMLFTFRQDLPFLDKIKKGIEDHFDLIALNGMLPNFIFSEILYDNNLKELLVNIIKEKAGLLLTGLKKEIDNEVKKGAIRYIEPYDLIFSIVSLNVFVFISKPVVSGVMNFDDNQLSEFLEHRKQINVEIILNRLAI